MAYDRLAESLRLLAGTTPASEARLSRRVRHVPLAFDRLGDVAATMFLRRGVNGVPKLDVHILELTDRSWRMLGGGSCGGKEALRARPSVGDSLVAGESCSNGGIARRSSRRLGWRQNNWTSWAELRLAQEVTLLRVGDRHLPVAAHGLAVVVWTTKQAPSVTAIDSTGVALGNILVGLRPLAWIHRPLTLERSEPGGSVFSASGHG